MDLMVLLLAVLMALTHARELKIDHGNLESYSSTTTLSLNDTLTVTKFMTTSTTTSSVPQSTTSQQNSDSGVFAVFAFNPGTPIHMQWMQAAGNSFWVGGEPATYCPSTVQEQGGCPPGNYTALSSCGMSTEVPGGQQLYATANGELSYTMAHSLDTPEGALACPFVHYPGPGSQYGLLTCHAFGALDLMACPTAGGDWKVLLALNDAETPSGDITDCIGFDALTLNTTDPAAWQYT